MQLQHTLLQFELKHFTEPPATIGFIHFTAIQTNYVKKPLGDPWTLATYHQSDLPFPSGLWMDRGGFLQVWSVGMYNY